MDNNLILNIEQTSKNYYKLKSKNKYIKINIKKILSPFGVDKQYGNQIIKFEIDQINEEHIKIINYIKDFEEKLKSQFDVKDDEWKSLINIRENNNIFLESKIKIMKGSILTKLSFNDKDNNYLKTIYELEKNFYSDIILEIPTLWDFRDKQKNENENKNKIGLVLNLFSINVH